MSVEQEFRDRVESFLSASGMTASDLGSRAVNNPSFVTRLRAGTSPTLATAEKVLAFICDYESSAAA
jgi:predicted transcriptional regulator